MLRETGIFVMLGSCEKFGSCVSSTVIATATLNLIANCVRCVTETATAIETAIETETANWNENCVS